jgi:hypothetical protein
VSWEDLSPVARHALVVSAMVSNVPIGLSDDWTVDRLSTLLATASSLLENGEGPTSAAEPPSRYPHSNHQSGRPASHPSRASIGESRYDSE